MSKTKEMVIDFRRKKAPTTPLVIKGQTVEIIIIIHKFSIALFPAERAQRACSHTCT